MLKTDYIIQLNYAVKLVYSRKIVIRNDLKVHVDCRFTKRGKKILNGEVTID